MTAVVDWPSVAFGNPNCGVLNMLNASARISRLVLSIRDIVRERPKSTLWNPGPVRMSRPELPNVYWAGVAKAEVSNQWPMVLWLDDRFPLPIRLGCWVVPVLLPSTLSTGVNDSPLCAENMPVSSHPPAIALPTRELERKALPFPKGN